MEVECDIGEGKVEHGMVGGAEGAKVNVLKEKVRKGNVSEGKEEHGMVGGAEGAKVNVLKEKVRQRNVSELEGKIRNSSLELW